MSLVPCESPLLLRVLDDLFLDGETFTPADQVHVGEGSVPGIRFFSEVQVLFLRAGDPERILVQSLAGRKGITGFVQWAGES